MTEESYWDRLSRKQISRRRLISGTALTGAGLVAAGMVGCGDDDDDDGGPGPSGGSTTAPASGGGGGSRTLNVGTFGTVEAWDVIFGTNNIISQTANQNITGRLHDYKTVTRQDANGNDYAASEKSTNFEGAVAESVEVTGDAIVWSLREGLTFPNGDPLDADAIMYTFDRVINAQSVGGFLGTIASLNGLDQVTTPDAGSLRIEGTNPRLLLPILTLQYYGVTNPKELEAAGGKTADDPYALEYLKNNPQPGAGAYRVSDYVPNDRLEFEGVSTSYSGEPFFNKVVLKDSPDATQRVLLLENGDLDYIEFPPVREIERLMGNEDVKVLSIPSQRQYRFQMTNSVAPFDNVNLRKAVASAIPYDQLVEQVYGGLASPCYSEVPEGMLGSDYSLWPWTYDPQRAAQLLSEAGYPNGEGLDPFTLTIRVGTEEDERSAIIIQSALDEIGIGMEIEKLPLAAFNQKTQSKEAQAFIDEWISWVNEPFYHLYWLALPDSPTNWNDWQNQQAGDLVAEGQLATEDDEVIRIAKEVQELIAEDCPKTWLYQVNFNVVTRADITGYRYDETEQLVFKYLGREG